MAARSLGLGTTFTTFHMFVESELGELLGIPKEIKFGVMIPIGWLQKRFRQGQAQADLQGNSLG